MTDVPDVDALVAELRARVEQRQREGHYPSGLTEELRQHFKRIAAHRSAVDFDVLRRQLDVVDNAATFDAARIPVDSGMPGGQKLHAAVAKLVSRQTQGALEQVQAFADATRAALRTILLALEEPHGHVHADLVGQVDSLFERLAAFERGPGHPEAAVADLRARIEALEAAARPTPAFTTERDAAAVARYLDGAAPVLHVGSGTGALLDALAALGIEATGVDADADAVAACTARGLGVEHDDPLRHLASCPDESLGAVVVDDRLPAAVALGVLVAARDKVRPGGRVVVDGRNPQSLFGLATRPAPPGEPLHAAYVEFVLRHAGFTDVRTEWRGEPEPPDDLTRVLYAPQDYAVVATR